ncbi:MAG: peptidylprolyl isomerase [Bacteroidaceae bacterium]|nr:peptidylprolyl isomerase [Bacteroidaceae bacterium]
MKRIALFILGFSFFIFAHAQTDPVVMRIAGQPVTRSELEYNYNKNNTENVIDRKDLEDYVDLFVNYKLKVRAAMDARMDTAQSFLDEFRTYRDQQIRPMLVPEGAEEREVRAYYDGMLARLDGHDLRLPAHIFLRVPQKSTAQEQQVQKERIDSLYRELRAGADFADVARRHSEDQQSAQRGGDLTWFGPGQLVPEFEKVMYALGKGEMSEPFLSTVGYHIVLLKDTKQLEPYDTLRPQIRRFLESRGMADRLAQLATDSLARERGLLPEQLLDQETERLTAQDTELRYLVQEYHDGLLLYEISKTQIWDPAARDTAALEQYFKKNQKRYAWAVQDTATTDSELQKDHRRYYGMAYYTRRPEDVRGVQKLLKKVPEAQWTQAVRDAYNKDSVTVRMEQPRLYRKGEHALVDSLAFKMKGTKPRMRKDYPHAAVVGRLLKKEPQRWTDIGSQVVADYQSECDRRFVEGLRKKYPVEIYPEVLATVNRHD